MEGWKEYNLSDVLTLIGGGTPKTSIPEYWNGDVPWISVADFVGDRKYITKTEKYITQKGLLNSSTKLLSPNDIVISARGTVGELGVVSLPMAFNQSCYGIRANGLIDSGYLFYLLKEQINELKSISHGSVFSTITRETFYQLKISLPPLLVQQRIAEILGALDDKIELNRLMNDTLEQMAQVFYKHYFVDEIDPENLPEGWKLEPLINLTDVRDGTHDSPKPVDFGFSLVTSKHLNKDGIDFSTTYQISEQDFININKRSKVDTFDILISMIGTVGLIYLVTESPVNYAIKNIGLIKTSKNKQLSYFIFCYLKSSFAQNYIETRKTGSTQQYLTLALLRDFPIITSPDNILSEFFKKTEPLITLINENNVESQLLQKKRDIILPKLISGELIPSDLQTIEQAL